MIAGREFPISPEPPRDLIDRVALVMDDVRVDVEDLCMWLQHWHEDPIFNLMRDIKLEVVSLCRRLHASEAQPLQGYDLVHMADDIWSEIETLCQMLDPKASRNPRLKAILKVLRADIEVICAMTVREV